MRRSWLGVALIACSACFAQELPSGPMRILVPSPPGGSNMPIRTTALCFRRNGSTRLWWRTSMGAEFVHSTGIKPE